MKPIEFHTDPMTGEAMYKLVGDVVVNQMNENDIDIISELLERSESFYPEQYEALCKEYSRSSENKRHYNFLRARRIVNCCFGVNDRQPDVDAFGNYNFEMVQCPLIAECLYHKIICQPTFRSELTEREKEVMKLYYQHVPTEMIARKLYLSIHTVNNHRRNSLQRLKLHSLEEFIGYAHSNNIFD